MTLWIVHLKKKSTAIKLFIDLHGLRSPLIIVMMECLVLKTSFNHRANQVKM